MSRTYVTSKRLGALRVTLTGRDWTVLMTLRQLRLASGRQLTRAHYPDVTPRRARQHLASMVQRGLIARLPRMVGGFRAGSAGYVYQLDLAGSRLLEPGQTFRRPDDPGGRLLDHSLAVSELFTDLAVAHRHGELTLVSFTAEPACWRHFSGPGGGRQVLKPDCAVVTQQGRFEDRWLIEVDRATEAVSVVQRKCELYRRYWQTGAEQARFEVFPRVLWLVPDQRRYDALIEVFGRLPVDVWPLFTVALAEDAVARIAQGAHQ
ncbi:replication-relaxation family protein [Kibdelosporangium philippinense]|uniref:Replication-relaxation family protein n=1 Tax=Kibdelosporangium philippinense TaxID=211113 RepID=A0ABS8ZJF7_9PSEU|nr:replication-relaxation family protein [Kibdelosporangium philippinense]MCE7006603.1 replication-relaxation family protein [Kibdelosporangium philippinense]